MFEPDSRVYYERRAKQATNLGDCATDPKVAAVHYEISLHYAKLSGGEDPVRPEILALHKDRGASPDPDSG